MSYNSDRDMVVASQIAYMDIPKGYEGVDVQTVLRENPALADKMQKDNIDVYNMIMAEGSDYGSWKVVDVQDENSKNGFYGCTIDKGDGSAIVGFRGSEEVAVWDNLKNDWVIADVGLLNETQTSQQESAANYMKEVYEKYGDQYDSFGVTGHSLGGNLAEHATLTAPEGLYDKIDRTLSIDGPGFSDEYLAAHAKAIAKRGSSLDHFQYSLVGAFLNPVPGSNYRNVQASEEEGLFWKHSTRNIIFDSAGNMIDGEPDELAVHAHALSQAADNYSTANGVWGVLQFLGLIPQTITSTPMLLQYLKDYYTYKKEAYDKAQAAKRMDARFAVNVPIVATAAEQLESYATSLQEAATEASNIRAEMDWALKAASIYTLSYRLRQKTKKLEKLSKRMRKLGEKGTECAEIYHQYEMAIKEIARA